MGLRERAAARRASPPAEGLCHSRRADQPIPDGLDAQRQTSQAVATHYFTVCLDRDQEAADKGKAHSQKLITDQVNRGRATLKVRPPLVFGDEHVEVLALDRLRGEKRRARRQDARPTARLRLVSSQHGDQRAARVC